MSEADAKQIARLINERNQLATEYTTGDILRKASDYEYEVHEGSVIACVQRRKVQWYQWEICHLSVAREWEGKGVAFAVYSRAEAVAQLAGARVLQCTIREGNHESERFFQRQGFSKVGFFFNTETGNAVGIWQKVLCPPQGGEAV